MKSAPGLRGLYPRPERRGFTPLSVNNGKERDVGKVLQHLPLGVPLGLFFSAFNRFLYIRFGCIGLKVLDLVNVTRKRGVVLGCRD